MKFQIALLAVQDVECSKKFYKELFEQEVVVDFGKNVTFSGGFAIQEDFAWLTDLPPNSIIQKSNNMELYFEVEHFDEFIEKLTSYKDIKYVGKPKQHDWKQWVVRIYDPDYHIIEIGESMKTVVRRCLREGCSIEETAKITQHPIEFVTICDSE